MFRLVAMLSLRRNVLTSIIGEKQLCTMKFFEKFSRKTLRIRDRNSKFRFSFDDLNILEKILCSRLTICIRHDRRNLVSIIIMRPSVKHPTALMPRPTKASLARQLKIRNSISMSSTTNTLKIISNEQNKSENDLRTIGLTKRTGIISKNHVLFKRRRSLNKLAIIVSSSSVENSTTDGETLKQVVSGFISLGKMKDGFSLKIVASLTENVKKMDLIGSENKENRSVKHPTKKPSVSLHPSEPIVMEQIEPISSTDSSKSEDEELIDPSYAMDYISDIMNLLYTLEKKYSIQSSFLTNIPTGIITVANGSAIRPWKLTAKHRTIVVGWIIQLFYARFHLSQDAMHM